MTSPQAFHCQVCHHVGPPNDGVEVWTDGRRFVGCEYCTARHEVTIDDSGAARRFTILRLFEEDRGCAIYGPKDEQQQQS